MKNRSMFALDKVQGIEWLEGKNSLKKKKEGENFYCNGGFMQAYICQNFPNYIPWISVNYPSIKTVKNSKKKSVYHNLRFQMLRNLQWKQDQDSEPGSQCMKLSAGKYVVIVKLVIGWVVRVDIKSSKM